MDLRTIETVKLFSGADRLRILGRLAIGPGSATEIAKASALPIRSVFRELGLLAALGLVERDRASGRDTFRLSLARLHELGRELGAEADALAGRVDAGAALEGVTTDDARVLRGFLEDGRLTAIPAQPAKRMVVLRWLLDRVFTEAREYPEKEVNQLIALVHPDVASLRRYLVDAGLVRREAGRYRRSVPTVDS